MRATEAFVAGTITGAVVAWLWGHRIEAYVGEQTRGVRTRAADGIRAVDEKAGEMLDRGGDSLRRAEGFLKDTREHVSDALRVGQDAIRPAAASADRGEPTA
jgi:hypothetical protein